MGLTAGQFLHAHLEELEDYLLAAEVAVLDNKAAELAEAVLAIARLVFPIAPFKPNQNLPDNWEDALRAWIFGEEASRVIQIGGDDAVDMLQDGFTYKLPWAMEAIRVVSKAAETERSDLFDGSAAMAVEVGSCHKPVMTLLRAGLASREAAEKAVRDTDADFDNHFRMTLWLKSEQVRVLSQRPDWPTDRTRTTWLNFVEGEKEEQRKPWTRTQMAIRARWVDGFRPARFATVTISLNSDGESGDILAPDMTLIGHFEEALPFTHRYIVDARINRELNGITLLYFGPP